MTLAFLLMLPTIWMRGRINEIGVETDKEAQAAMAAIGTATNKRMAEMMEAHEDHMVFARTVLEQKAKADSRHRRRFDRP